jgi:hypothetical protein
MITNHLFDTLKYNWNDRNRLCTLSGEQIPSRKGLDSTKSGHSHAEVQEAGFHRMQPRNVFDKYFCVKNGSLVANRPTSNYTRIMDCLGVEKLSNLATHMWKGKDSNSHAFKVEEIANFDAAIAQAKKDAMRCRTTPLYIASETCCSLPKDNVLESNLALGEEILSDTLDAILFSPNNLERSKVILEERAEGQSNNLSDLSQLVSDANRCLKVIRNTALPNIYSEFILNKMKAKIANDVHIGNCGEIALVAFFKALERGLWDLHLDLIHIIKGDHAFLVLGRQPGSDPENYNTWGSSAVVVDPWAGKVYPLYEVKNKLYDYIEVDSMTGAPKLRPFDPKTQHLKVFFGNTLCFKQELLKEKNNYALDKQQHQAYDTVVEQLERFHQTSALDEKLAAATSLDALCNDSKISSLASIIMLRDQIEHFIELGHIWTGKK